MNTLVVIIVKLVALATRIIRYRDPPDRRTDAGRKQPTALTTAEGPGDDVGGGRPSIFPQQDFPPAPVGAHQQAGRYSAK